MIAARRVNLMAGLGGNRSIASGAGRCAWRLAASADWSGRHGLAIIIASRAPLVGAGQAPDLVRRHGRGVAPDRP